MTVIQLINLRSMVCSFYPPLYIRSKHTRRQVAATNHSDSSLRVYRTGNKLLQYIVATHRSDKSLRVCWRIFVSLCNRILSLQQVAQILCDLIFCNMLLQQTSVAETKIFTKILQYTQSDLSLWWVAVTCCCTFSPSVYPTFKGI